MNTFPDFDTGPFDPATPAGREPPPSDSILAGVDVAGRTHCGQVRLRNEDNFFIARFGRFLETLETSLQSVDLATRFSEAGYGMVTADGLGGHAGGEEASRLAITTFVNLVLATPDWILRLDDDAEADRVMQRAQERFEQTSRTMAY
jgi:serine/threonine protein phosphatase PrpC